jgi:hypothetical protein
MKIAYLPNPKKDNSEWETKFAWLPTAVGTNSLGIGAMAWLETYEEKRGEWINATTQEIWRRPTNAPPNWTPEIVERYR